MKLADSLTSNSDWLQQLSARRRTIEALRDSTMKESIQHWLQVHLNFGAATAAAK
jgi:hypothetical protein